MDKIIKITIQKGFTVCLFLLIGFSAIGASRSPEIVAHRAGTADAPENTYLAIDTALKIMLMLFGSVFNQPKMLNLFYIALVISMH